MTIELKLQLCFHPVFRQSETYDQDGWFHDPWSPNQRQERVSERGCWFLEHERETRLKGSLGEKRQDGLVNQSEIDSLVEIPTNFYVARTTAFFVGAEISLEIFWNMHVASKTIRGLVSSLYLFYNSFLQEMTMTKPESHRNVSFYFAKPCTDPEISMHWTWNLTVNP